MAEPQWKVGDLVALCANRLGRTNIIVYQRTVRRVAKRFIELDDGSRWTHDGYGYPRNRRYTFQTPERWGPEHDVIVQRNEVQRRLDAHLDQQSQWRHLDTDKLKRLVAVLDEVAPLKTEGTDG